MILREVIGQLDELPDEATLYVEGEPSEWAPESTTAFGVEDLDAEFEVLPPEADGLTYFLEVLIARDVLSGWESTQARKPTLDEKTDRIIRYARYDA